jgi:hypothetical protein
MRYSLIGREVTHDALCEHLSATGLAGTIAVVACDKPPVGTLAALPRADDREGPEATRHRRARFDPQRRHRRDGDRRLDERHAACAGDRARRGDVCNKIGTYLKALAAHASGVPFYVALPQTAIDWTIEDGLRDIPIEERDPREVTHMTGRLASGGLATVHITAPGSPVSNFAFDVTPAEYVTALITDRGVCAASADGLRSLFKG